MWLVREKFVLDKVSENHACKSMIGCVCLAQFSFSTKFRTIFCFVNSEMSRFVGNSFVFSCTPLESETNLNELSWCEFGAKASFTPDF